MADFNVEALGLASPPVSAHRTTYTPAIAVRNVGAYPADVTGQLTILDRDTGALVFTSYVTCQDLQPGADGTATSETTWSADTEGTYVAFGFVTTDGQNDPNLGQLPPTTIVVSGGPVPPPVTVPAHAAQHQSGGSDEMVVDNLAGALREPQTPNHHASSHQAAGADALNVSGLAGILADPQEPVTHGNERHSVQLATSAELTAHEDATAAHPDAANLANLETSGDDEGLVPGNQLAHTSESGGDPDNMYLSLDRAWRVLSLHGACPTGLICLWDGTASPPTGWRTFAGSPPVTPPYIWIKFLGTGA